MADFFKSLTTSLQQAHFALPTLIIDQSSLDANLAQVQHILPATITPRIVVKSLPAIELITYIAQRLSCTNFMVFHQPHLALILDAFPAADILLGKPMPIRAAQNFYEQYPGRAQAPIQWLIDSRERLQQYLALALSHNLCLSISIEIDIGLHRGGIADDAQFKALLALIAKHPEQLSLSGFMGYDAHVGKIPKLITSAEQSYRVSQQRYQHHIDVLRDDFPALYRAGLCMNGAGSLTLGLHATHTVCNDVSLGSMLLKPTDFDLATLTDFQPALWIATPVLKKLSATQIPGIPLLSRLYRQQQALFIYGGNWLADYVYPIGAKPNALYGRSSNQELINVPLSAQIQVDDFVFLRPTQSEAVISQFEQVWLHHAGTFTPWRTFRA